MAGPRLGRAALVRGHGGLDLHHRHGGRGRRHRVHGLRDGGRVRRRSGCGRGWFITDLGAVVGRWARPGGGGRGGGFPQELLAPNDGPVVLKVVVPALAGLAARLRELLLREADVFLAVPATEERSADAGDRRIRARGAGRGVVAAALGAGGGPGVSTATAVVPVELVEEVGGGHDEVGGDEDVLGDKRSSDFRDVGSIRASGRE